MEFEVLGKNGGATYKIAEGAVFVENQNETLDSGTIKASQLAAKIQIEPYDRIAIYEGGVETRRFCVDGYDCVQTSLQPPMYDYQISLFSETKVLEGISCPNMAITRRLVGTQRKISDVIQDMLDRYCPKTDSDAEHGAYGNEITIGQDVHTAFDGVDCPELQWNQPTLREVLNDLMMVRDRIPVLRQGVLHCMDLGEVGSPLSAAQLKGVNYVRESRGSDDYVSEIKVHTVNAANNDAGVHGRDCVRIVEGIGFRNDEAYLLDDRSLELQTSFPIWKLHSLTMKFRLYVKLIYLTKEAQPQSNDINVWINDLEVPIEEYVLEHGVWRTKPIYYAGFTPAEKSCSTDYQNTCLYYVRGQRNIRNFSAKQDINFLFIQNQAYVFQLITRSDATRAAVDARGEEFNPYPDDWEYERCEFTTDVPVWYEASFKADYDALDDFVFTASKQPFLGNRRTIIDHQTNSYVDVNRLGNLEYLKAKRLGNETALINARYKTESEAPTLTQTYGGKIVYRRELSVYRHHVDVNLLACENYVMRDYFTGVKSKLRSWRLAEGSDVLTRAEHEKFYVNGDIDSVWSDDRLIPVYKGSDPMAQYLGSFNVCMVRFWRDVGASKAWYPADARYPLNSSENPPTSGTVYTDLAIECEFTKHRVGNSVVFTIKMPDNVFAGRYISNLQGTGGKEQQSIRYTDDDGEADGAVLYFYTDRSLIPAMGDATAEFCLKPLSKFYDPTYSQGSEPPSGVAKIPVAFHKDNKEIAQISIQFEWNESANDLFLGYKTEQ